MISKQIIRKHWVSTIYFLMGFFLFISFSLPFSAEGKMLEINDQFCTEPGERVIFDITINRNSSDPMEDFTFTIIYDDDILEYIKSTHNSISSLSVKQGAASIKCSGQGKDIDDYVHELGSLVFDVKKCEATTLTLMNLSGGLAGWGTSDGHLSVREESEGSGYIGYSPYTPVYGTPFYAYGGFGGYGGFIPYPSLYGYSG